MYLTEFDTKFDVFERNNEMLLFVPSYQFPMDYISMPTVEHRNKRVTSWCNLNQIWSEEDVVKKQKKL